MAKRVARKTKKSAPKRSAKGMKRSKKYSTWKNVKCTLDMPLQFRNDFLHGTDKTSARALIYWQNTTSTGSDIIDVMTLADSKEFQLYSSVYFTCSVNSVRIDYKPYKAVAPAYTAESSVMEYRDLKAVSWINENEWP